AYLDEITEIKLTALHELTDEALRADQTFSIFLMQCANLISKIQMKIIGQGREEEPVSPGDESDVTPDADRE
ncbi:MAG: hypothetical protein AAF492_12240, partial [Verrucomicrobiota bacterium]